MTQTSEKELCCLEKKAFSGLLHDLFGDIVRCRFVVIEFHREGGSTLRSSSARPWRNRTFTTAAHRVDGLARRRIVHEPCSTPRRRLHVAHDVAEVILRRHDFDLHDRLEQDRLRLAKPSLKAADAPAILNAISDESTSWYEPNDQL
jgi:hypothetical protein